MKKPAKEELLADLLSSATWAEIAAKYGYSDPRFLRRLPVSTACPSAGSFSNPRGRRLSA